MERYIGIEPLEGPAGVKLSTVFTPQPKPCGVITSACKYPEEVFKLFDLMLSEEEEQIKKIRADIEDYVNKTVIAFIVGEKNIWSDEEWEWMKVEFENLGLSEFLSVAQQAYDRGR